MKPETHLVKKLHSINSLKIVLLDKIFISWLSSFSSIIFSRYDSLTWMSYSQSDPSHETQMLLAISNPTRQNWHVFLRAPMGLLIIVLLLYCTIMCYMILQITIFKSTIIISLLGCQLLREKICLLLSFVPFVFGKIMGHRKMSRKTIDKHIRSDEETKEQSVSSGSVQMSSWLGSQRVKGKDASQVFRWRLYRGLWAGVGLCSGGRWPCSTVVLPEQRHTAVWLVWADSTVRGNSSFFSWETL